MNVSSYLDSPSHSQHPHCHDTRLSTIIWLVSPDSADQHQRLAHEFAVPVMKADYLAEVLERTDRLQWGCVLIDYPTLAHEVLINRVTFDRERPGYPLVVWSSNLNVEKCMQSVRWGAVDVLRRIDDDQDLPAVVRKAIQQGFERSQSFENRQAVAQRLQDLSTGERQVLAAVLRGRTNKAIATELGCSLRTVESRRQRILTALQVENAIELAAKLGRYGVDVIER